MVGVNNVGHIERASCLGTRLFASNEVKKMSCLGEIFANRREVKPLASTMKVGNNQRHLRTDSNGALLIKFVVLIPSTLACIPSMLTPVRTTSMG